MRRALGVMLALGLGPMAAMAACEVPTGAAQMMAEAGRAVNAQRAGNGKGALRRDARLDKAAMAHACWMAETGTFSHQSKSGGKSGSLPKARIRATGYRTRLTAENIAWGQTSGAQVVAEWMTSPGHRKNILMGSLDEYGIGVAVLNGRPVWVMTYAAQ